MTANSITSFRARAARLFGLSLILVTAFGCARNTSDVDPFSGSWEGGWYIGNSPEPAGWVKCTSVRVGNDVWKAVFETGFGGEAIYEFDVEGKLVGDRVVFEGKVDLGQTSGGVFTWRGEADGDKFGGTYSSSFVKGRFDLLKVVDQSAVLINDL